MASPKTAFPSFRKTLAAASAALALCGAVGSAQAALVTGRFDPDFGGNLPGIGFQGTATFSIDQACLDLNTGPGGAFVYASYNCGNGGSGMSFLGAHVDFYNLSDNSAAGTVDFAADPLAVLGMYVQDHQVVGLQTAQIGPSTSSGLTGGDKQFLLQFGYLNFVIGPDEDHFPGNDGDEDLDDYGLAGFQQTTMFVLSDNGPLKSNPAQSQYSVPEPGSAALALAALLAVGALRRRTR